MEGDFVISLRPIWQRYSGEGGGVASSGFTTAILQLITEWHNMWNHNLFANLIYCYNIYTQTHIYIVIYLYIAYWYLYLYKYWNCIHMTRYNNETVSVRLETKIRFEILKLVLLAPQHGMVLRFVLVRDQNSNMILDFKLWSYIPPFHSIRLQQYASCLP